MVAIKSGAKSTVYYSYNNRHGFNTRPAKRQRFFAAVQLDAASRVGRRRPPPSAPTPKNLPKPRLLLQAPVASPSLAAAQPWPRGSVRPEDQGSVLSRLALVPLCRQGAPSVSVGSYAGRKFFKISLVICLLVPDNHDNSSQRMPIDNISAGEMYI